MLEKAIAACLSGSESLLLKKYLGKVEAESASPLPDSEHLYEAERIYVSHMLKPWPVKERRVLGEILALPQSQSLVIDYTPNTLKADLLAEALLNLLVRDIIEKKTAASIFVLCDRVDFIPLSWMGAIVREAAPVPETETSVADEIKLSCCPNVESGNHTKHAKLMAELSVSIQAMQEGLRLVRAIFNIHEELDEEYRRHGGLKSRLQELTESLLVSEEKLNQIQKNIAADVQIKASFFKKLFSGQFKRHLKKQADVLSKAETEQRGFVRAQTRAHEDWLRLSEAIEQFSLWLARYGIGPVAFFDLLDWDALEAAGAVPDLLSTIDVAFRQKQAQLLFAAEMNIASNLYLFLNEVDLLLALNRQPALANWLFIDKANACSTEVLAAILNKTERIVVLNDLTASHASHFVHAKMNKVDGMDLPELPLAKLKSFSTQLPALPIRSGNSDLNQLACMILKLKPTQKLQLDSDKVRCYIESDIESQQNTIKDILKSQGARLRSLVVADSLSYFNILSSAFKRRKQVQVAQLDALPNESFDIVFLASDINDESSRPYPFDKEKESIAKLLMLAEKQIIILGRFDLVGAYETTGLAQILRYATRVNRLEIESVE